MQVHYKKRRGIIFLVSGCILVVARLYLFSLRNDYSDSWHLLASALIAAIGFLYLKKPYFELRSNELVVFGLLGNVVKRYGFSQFSDFYLEGSKLYLNAGGKTRRVWVSKMVAANEEWDLFIDRITGHDLTRELHNV